MEKYEGWEEAYIKQYSTFGYNRLIDMINQRIDEMIESYKDSQKDFVIKGLELARSLGAVVYDWHSANYGEWMEYGEFTERADCKEAKE